MTDPITEAVNTLLEEDDNYLAYRLRHHRRPRIYTPCLRCDGTGELKARDQRRRNRWSQPRMVTCTRCGGSGKE